MCEFHYKHSKRTPDSPSSRKHQSIKGYSEWAVMHNNGKPRKVGAVVFVHPAFSICGSWYQCVVEHNYLTICDIDGFTLVCHSIQRDTGRKQKSYFFSPFVFTE